jgi:cell division protein FtsI/penicillin-binding protein 2
MMKTSWTNNKPKKPNEKDNRIRFVMAVVFLFGFALIGRLFNIQVLKYDYYLAKAADQHTTLRQLEPKRGRIFMQDHGSGITDTLYPLATNKDFATVFLVPRDVADEADMARKLYYFFDRDRVLKDVEEMFKPKPTAAGGATSTPEVSPEERELREIRKKEEYRQRRENIVQSYVDRLGKKNSQYDAVHKKVDEVDLRRLYLYLLSDSAAFQPDENGDDRPVPAVDADGLFVRDGRLMRKKVDTPGDERVEIKGISYNWHTYRFYPEGSIGSHISGFAFYDDHDVIKGSYGLEGFFDKELTGVPGSIRSEKSAGGSAIIVNNREFNKPVNGSDIILTIDRSVQFAACTRLNAAVARHGADGGSVVILDPKTGAIMAMCSSPDFDPNNYNDVKDIAVYNNPAIFDQYEPGSIFKSMTVAAGLDAQKISPESTFEDKGVVKIAGFDIKNSDKKAHGVVTMTYALAESLNTGMIHIARQVGLPEFKSYLVNFGFGEKGGIELGGEAKGDIRNLDDKKHKELYTYTASYGQGISVTPLQMVTAYGALANGGQMMKPYLVKEIIQEDGRKVSTQPQVIRQVVSERTANLVSGMLVNVVESGHGKRAGVAGYYIGGKTGTAQVPRKDGRGYEEGKHIGSFAGYGPIEDPAFVMVVRINNPRDVMWAESSAAPLFGEIAEFILNYKQIPPSRKVEQAKK